VERVVRLGTGIGEVVLSQRIIIYGAGAVGSVMGALLHRNGCECVLIARGAHLEAIQRNGLTLIRPEGTSRHLVHAVGHPREIGFAPGDVVVLTMKTQDVAAALDDLTDASGRALPIVCAQNGVESERVAARRFADVYGMLVWLPAMFLEPGQVISYGSPSAGLLDAGCYPEGSDARIEALTQTLDASGLAARAQPHIMRWKYNKLLSNLFNALMACLGPGADFGPFPARIQEEALACYAAAGIEYISEEEAKEKREAVGVGTVPIAGQPQLAGSSWQSLYRGLGSIETDYLNGEIVLLGQLHGVPTPYNRALQEAANQLARNGEKPGCLTLADLEARVAVAGGSERTL
jgi:2-dehydropantoate 2-reductase